MASTKSPRRPPVTPQLPPSTGSVLGALLVPLEADGGAVIDHQDGEPVVLCEAGTRFSVNLRASSLLAAGSSTRHGMCGEGHPVIVGPWQTLAGRPVLLAFQRKIGAPLWKEPDHKLVLTVAAALSALLLHTAPPRKEVGWRSPIDALTGLPKARKLFEELPRHFARLDREGLSGTLILVNIDGFRQINDLFGRRAGDDMLRQAAKLMQGMARPTDVVARIGDDEFALWLNGMDHFTAAERAERLRLEAPRLA